MLAGMKKGLFYRRSLTTVLWVACMPTIVIGLLLYWVGIPQIEGEFNLLHRNELADAMNRIDDTFTDLELSASQWAFNPIFDNQLRSIDLRDQFAVTQNLFKTLSVMKGSNPIIDQVQLYLQHVSAVLSDDRGVTPLSAGEDSLYRALMANGQTFFWTDLLPSTAGVRPNGANISLVVKLPGGGIGQNYGMLIVYLDKQKLNHLIGDLTSKIHGASLLIRDDGQLISNGHGDVNKESEFEKALREQVLRLKKEQTSESMLFDWKNDTYSVSFPAC